MLTLHHGNIITTLTGLCPGVTVAHRWGNARRGEAASARDWHGCLCLRSIYVCFSKLHPNPKPHLCLRVRESKFIFRAIPHQQFNLYQDMCAEGPSHPIQEHSVPSATALMRGHAKQPWESARACVTASHPSAGARERIVRILLTVPLVLIRHHAENGAKSLFCGCCFQMGANFRKFSGDSVPVYRWCST